MAQRPTKPKPRAKKPRRVVDSLAGSVLKATLESTGDGILVVDLDGKIVAHNRRFEEIFDLFETFPQDQSMLDRLRTGARKSARPTWEEGWVREAKPVLLGPAFRPGPT